LQGYLRSFWPAVLATRPRVRGLATEAKSCAYYKAGPLRRVPGRRGMTYEEPEWVDEQETAHREWDE
jgi:hypothetical protein